MKSSSSGVLSSTESSSLRGSQSEHDAPDATTTSGTPRLLAEVDVDDRDLADDGEEEEEEEESELDADGIERGTTVVNNIGYALKGYDLLKGNPLDAVGLVKVDLGFRGAIFEPVDYVATPDRQYYTPKDVNVVECEGCNLAFSSYQMHSTADYSSALSAKVSVSGRGGIGAFKGSFSASAGYQEANERFSEKHETSTAAEVSCCVYQAELSAFALPPFSENFLEALEALSANPDATVSKFVREFGTHYVKKVTMGSIYGEQTYLSADAVSAMVQKEINIEMAASASGAFASGNVEAELDFSQSKLETFRSSAEKRSVYARGAKPPTDGDVGAVSCCCGCWSLIAPSDVSTLTLILLSS